ncbi:MAG: DUF1015 family protein [Leptospiraceae bacterium]|nr:DUF1015 family protein [Leptospiraceae bacterium]MDW7975851.1 DUF1015 family protein [Leptospiraceae bacterium]
MVKIKPFRAYLPNPDLVESIVSPPYDVVEIDEIKEIINRKGKYSFLRITRSEVDFEKIDPYDVEVYHQAKKNLEEFINQNVFFQIQEETFFIYRLQWQDVDQSGIVGLTHIDDYMNNKIKKHELTRPDKEKDRFDHIDILGFNCEPVFFAFKSEESQKLTEFLGNHTQKDQNLLYDVIDDQGIRHRVYIVNKREDQQLIRDAFRELSCIYIADGHHRTASTVNVGLKRKQNDPNYHPEKSYNYFLSVTFPSHQLKILPYNRVVTDLNGLSENVFLEKLKEKFHVFEKKQQLSLHSFNMFLEDQWYHLKLKPEFYREKEIDRLDVSYLQDYVLKPLLGIDDPRTSKRIHFIGGIKGEDELEKWVQTKKGKVAFSLYPTPISSLFKIADNEEIMPPKSTWFEPKLKSGFFLYDIDEDLKK